MAKKRFRVLAEHRTVAGHSHGEEFELDCEAEGLNEEALLKGGLLQLVAAKPAAKSDKTKEE